MALSDYEILGGLARQGLLVIYRARRRATNEVARIDMLTVGWEGEPTLPPGPDRDHWRARLEAVALLCHPNILPVIEIGEDDHLLYVVRPHVEADFLNRIGTMPPRQAGHLVGQLAGAVQHANEHGIFHCNIRPGNVLVAGDVPLLIGFDCARVRFLYPPLEEEPNGSIVGSPAFMAPEMARGGARDAGTAVDVWGLGALLFTLLTGRPPFQAPTVVDTLIAAMEREPPSPRSLNPAIDPDLETICLKCLRKAPAQRYPEARDVAEDLARYLAGEPITSQQPPSLGGRLRGWVRGWLGGP